MAIDPVTGQQIPDFPIQNTLVPGSQAVNPVARAPQTGLIGSEQALRGGLQESLGVLQQGLGAARQDLSPFAQTGGQAANIQAALTGALGPQQQSQAFANFQQDPGQQFLQQQGEQAVLRNQAAIGGTGGGNVRRELTRFGQGLSSQGLQQRLQNLGDISGQGLAAAGQRSNLAQQGGLTGANLLTGTARDVSQGRLQAGRDLASSIGGTTSALSNLINQQGTGLAAGIESGGLNLANILSGTGQAVGGQQTELARLLANIATQQSVQLPSSAQLLEGGGIGAGVGSLIGGIGAAISDVRLKTNIRPVGKTQDGHNLYIWDWAKEAINITGEKFRFGVLAQEIMHKLPDAVMMHADGFYRVDYSKVN